MPTPYESSTAARAGAAAALAALVTALIYGTATPNQEARIGHAVIGAAPEGAVATWYTVQARGEALALFGFDAGGAALYARARLCAVPLSDDAGEAPLNVPGLVVVPEVDPDGGFEACVPYLDGGRMPILEAWTQDHPAAEPLWTCACCPKGATCVGEIYRMLEPPTWGPVSCCTEFREGAWADDGGWKRRPCGEITGFSAMPVECRL